MSRQLHPVSSTDAVSSSDGATHNSSSLPRRFLYGVVACCLVAASAAAVLLYREYHEQLRYSQERLTRLADVNQRLLENWVKERKEDARLMASLSCAKIAVLGWAEQEKYGSQLCRQRLQEEIASVVNAFGYAGAYVVDSGGRVVAQSVASPPLDRGVLRQVLTNSQTTTVTVPASGGRASYSQVAFVALVRRPRPPGAKRETSSVIGHIVLLTHPEAIASLLPADKGAAATGETILVAMQADQPVFISPLHYAKAKKLPQVPPGSPGLITLLEKRDLFGAYHDYRGISVLAATRYLPDLGWAVVTKVDRSEALSDFRQTFMLGITIALLSILTVVSVGAAWLRHERVQRLELDLAFRKQTEENLRLSVGRFLVALQNSPVVVFNQDRELRYTWINQPVTPWSETEYLGKTDEDIIGPDDGSRLSALKRPVLASGVGARKEWSFVHRGEKRVYDINIQPLRDEAGKVVGITCASTDVTERKRAEERLREYEKVVEELHEMIVVVDRDYRYLITNRAFLNYRGIEREQLIGLRISDVVDKDIFANVFKPKLDECLRGKAVIFETQYSYPRLGKRDLLVSYFPIAGAGSVDRIACVLQDVTDRKRAEKALRDSETRYRLLFERNPAGMFRSTLDGKLLEANETFARMFGYESPDELLRLPNIRFYLHPEERPPLITKLQAEGYLPDYEICCRHRDGSPVWVLANMAFVAGKGGAPDLLEGTFVNVTKRKKAEEALRRSETRLRAFMENAPYGIFSYANDRFLNANPALVRMLGFDTEAQVTELHVPSDVFREAVECRNLMDLGGQRSHFGPLETQWKRRDGHGILVRLSGRIAVAPRNGERILEAIAEDITQPRALEEHLRQTDKMEALGRLASGVAHDFNNLVQGVTLNLEHAIERAGHVSGPVREDIEQALQAARSAGLLTRQLLIFGRKRALQPKLVNLNDVVVRSQDLVNRLAGENIHVNMRLGPNLSPVTVDPVQVQQVILNLVANARDAISGKGQITIRTGNIDFDKAPSDEYFTAVPKAGAYVVLEISDNGTGINREELTHIFEPFYTTKAEGTGLGLSTSYGIVTQSSGYMSVQSEPGRGTTVRSYLPRWQEASSESELPPGQAIGLTCGE